MLIDIDRADVLVGRRGGTLVLFKPVSPEGKQWVEDNVALEPYQWTGDFFVVEPRYVDPLVETMREEGIMVVEG